MVGITCCNCGVEFSMTDALYRFRRADKGMFYCPNGHIQSYTESEADRLRKEVDSLRQSRVGWMNTVQELENTIEKLNRSIRAYKGIIARKKNR